MFLNHRFLIRVKIKGTFNFTNNKFINFMPLWWPKIKLDCCNPLSN